MRVHLSSALPIFDMLIEDGVLDIGSSDSWNNNYHTYNDNCIPRDYDEMNPTFTIKKKRVELKKYVGILKTIPTTMTFHQFRQEPSKEIERTTT